MTNQYNIESGRMNRLKELRKKLQMSQVALSKWIGCTQSNLSKIESGEYKLNANQIYIIENLCKARNIEFSMEYLINKKPSHEG